MAKATTKTKAVANGHDFKLREETGSFYDHETGLTITRSEVVQIDKSNAGAKTLAAIHAGGLIEVRSESKQADGEGKEE